MCFFKDYNLEKPHHILLNSNFRQLNSYNKIQLIQQKTARLLDISQ